MFSFVKKDWGKQDLELKQSIPAPPRLVSPYYVWPRVQ